MQNLKMALHLRLEKGDISPEILQKIVDALDQAAITIERSIVERIKSRELLNDDDSAAFAVGLKLFSEIVLENRDKPFFQELGPQVAAIMKVIKGTKP